MTTNGTSSSRFRASLNSSSAFMSGRRRSVSTRSKRSAARRASALAEELTASKLKCGAASRHHDDGQRQPARVQFPEHGDAVHVRKVVVEQQHVVVILRETRQTLLAGVDNIERDIGSGGGEVCLDQVGVGGIVFRVENP